MHRLARSYDTTAKRRGNRLMPETHAQDRNLLVQLAHDFQRAAGLRRRARTGRQDDRLRPHRSNRGYSDRIVAHDDRLLPQPLEIASQVEDEAVVVVDEEEQGTED